MFYKQLISLEHTHTQKTKFQLNSHRNSMYNFGDIYRQKQVKQVCSQLHYEDFTPNRS